MKTLEQTLKSFESGTLDGRDSTRLAQFIPEKDLHLIDIGMKDEYKGTHKAIPFTRENILKQLEEDVAFGFEKALNKRGISSSLMFDVVRMWNNILEEGLENWSDKKYAQYGLPLFKATAVKYGFENPIGKDEGWESQYSDDWE